MFYRLVLLLVLGTLWAVHVALSKQLGLVAPTDIIAALLIYLSGSALLLLTGYLVCKRRLPRFRGSGGFFWLTGAFGYVIPIGLELIVVPHISLGLFLLASMLTPVVTLAGTWLFGLRRLSLMHLLSVLTGLTAMLLLIGDSLADLNQAGFWLLFALLVPLCYGCIDCYIEARRPIHLGLFDIAVNDALIAVGYVIAVALVLGVDVGIPGQMIADFPGELGALIGVNTFTIALFFQLVISAGAIYVSFGLLVALVVGLVIGATVFDDVLPLLFWPALAVMVLSVGLLHYASRDQSETNTTS